MAMAQYHVVSLQTDPPLGPSSWAPRRKYCPHNQNRISATGKWAGGCGRNMVAWPKLYFRRSSAGWDPTEIRSRPKRKVLARAAVLNGHWLCSSRRHCSYTPTPQSPCLKFRNTFRHGRDVLRAHRTHTLKYSGRSQSSTDSDYHHRSAATSPCSFVKCQRYRSRNWFIGISIFDFRGLANLPPNLYFYQQKK